MKMSDVRVGMRLRRIAAPGDNHLLVTEINKHGFGYSIPDDEEIQSSHWSMPTSRSGHQYFKGFVDGYLEEVEPGKIYPIPPPPPPEEPKETIGAIEQLIVFVALGGYLATGNKFKPPGWDTIAMRLLHRLERNGEACDAYLAHTSPPVSKPE